MDESIIERFVTLGKTQWWFVGRRKILSYLMRGALGPGQDEKHMKRISAYLR